jgi:hypothetical protein
MIIDEVVWNVIKNKHCSFRVKYLSHNPEPNLKTSAKMNTISLVSAIANHVRSPIPNTPPSAKKKESATST